MRSASEPVMSAQPMGIHSMSVQSTFSQRTSVRTARLRAALVFAAALLAGCGNYSNEDLLFLAAIPSSAQLHVQVPASNAQALRASTSPACPLGVASSATNAQTQGDGLNTAIENILNLVDLVRAVPPTRRDDNHREWGPWNDAQHPGVRNLITMDRTPSPIAADVEFVYQLSGSLDGGAWLPVLSGDFFGSEASHGTGKLTLDFHATRQLGTNGPNDPDGPLIVNYALGSEPRTIDLELDSNAGFGLTAKFNYHWAGYLDGRAIFDFTFTDPTSGNVFTVDASFNAKGEGRATLTGTTPSNFSASATECFDGTSCITWASDQYAILSECNGVRPCNLGSQSACPAGLP
jgi:hypothetical protein